MKKKIPFKDPLKVKKWQLFLGIVCAIGFTISIVVGLNTINEKKEVSAHPTNTIKLDEGGANEFEVPTDAQNLVEPALTAQDPTYDNFVQRDSEPLPILVKEKVETYWSEQVFQQDTTTLRSITWHVRDVGQTREGNYFVLLGAYGTNTGGVFAICVINRQGDYLFKETVGVLRNNTNRINTKLFSSSNGVDFLVGTNENKYYRYTLDSETSTSVNVNRAEVLADTTNSPQNVFGVGYFHILDSTQNTTEETAVTGTVYFDWRNNVNGDPMVRFRIPIGTISIDGWRNGINPNIDFNTQYLYSLESYIPPDATTTYGIYYGHVNAISSTMTDEHVYGSYDYTGIKNEEGNTIRGTTMKCVQIFDKADTYNDNGRTVIRQKFLYENRSSNAEILMLNELCTDDEIYFISTEETESRLIKVDLRGPNAYVIQELKTYPRDTIINIIENPNDPTQLFYFGSTSSFTGEFEHPVLSGLTGSSFYIQGIMDNNFEKQSIYGFAIDDKVYPDFMKQGDGRALIFGRTFSNNDSFIDKHIQVGEEGELTENSIPDETVQEAFVGVLKAQDDYPPVIKSNHNISMDITDPDLSNSNKNALGWTPLDNWLITGSKNGSLNDANSPINVYDYMDSNNTSYGQNWLNKRINRNPKDINANIEWDKLGFDISNTGPQRVTYFVTDSEWHVSSNSRWVNKKTPQTIEEDEYALDAQNFHIPLTGIDTVIPDATKFKELAKTMAWNMEDGVVDEDGTDSSKLSDKVTVDTDQLKALREATVAKPYPVDVTYTPETGVSVTNRVWVFVTTKNTLPNNESIYPEVTPDETNGIVYYADDYSIPFRSRGTHGPENVLDMGNVRVYDYYDSNNENSSELPVLADKDNTDNLEVLFPSLMSIRTAPQPGVIHFGFSRDQQPLVQYTWDGTISGYHRAETTQGGLDVTLTGDVLLHVRQVILDESDQLVVPTEGYLNIKTNLHDGAPVEDSDELRKVKIPSEKNEDTPTFETFAVSTEHLTNPMGMDDIELAILLPEFYERAGVFITRPVVDGGAARDGSDHQNKSEHEIGDMPLVFNKNLINREEEYFITIYLKPKLPEKGPQPYSWDYKVNDFGNIKTK